jgi:RNA polymerase sigma-70 factor (ECF subfamily)
MWTARASEDRAERFRALALPHLDDVYSLARYLTGSAADADDAAQECYLRALAHFDTYRGPAIRPWLFAILRNVCRGLRAKRADMVELDTDTHEDALPLWGEAQPTPEAEILAQRDADSIRRLLAALPDAFREVIVLRDIHDLSYREIADVVGAPIGTVMSRLARARALMRTGWNAEEPT